MTVAREGRHCSTSSTRTSRSTSRERSMRRSRTASASARSPTTTRRRRSRSTTSRSRRVTRARRAPPSPSASVSRAGSPSPSTTRRLTAPRSPPPTTPPPPARSTSRPARRRSRSPSSCSGDLLDEANETFTLNLTNAINATIADNQGVGTINDDDPLPALTINDVSVTEGDTRNGRSHLHRLALAAQRALGDGRLRDRQQHGRRARRLPRPRAARSPSLPARRRNR